VFNATKNKSSAISGRLKHINLGMFIVDFLNHVNRHQLRTSNREGKVVSNKNDHGFIGISLTFMR
jgi:hypothetical protein